MDKEGIVMYSRTFSKVLAPGIRVGYISAPKEIVAKIKEKAGDRYFKKDHTHASKAGAQMNAQSMAKGLRAIHSPLAEYLKK
jgi:DNA-binding transcriptional MocR family regulator